MEVTVEEALRRGIAAHKAGKVQEAEHCYRAILKSQPLHPDANHNLGVLAVSVNKAGAALSFFKKALEANSAVEQFWLSYIDCLIREKQIDTAKGVFEQAKQAGVALAKLQLLEKRLRSGLVSSSDAPQQGFVDQPRSAPDELSPAIELRELGKYTEAQEWLNKFIGSNSNHPEALSLLSQVLLLDKKEVEAERALLAAASIDPDLLSVCRNQARLLLKQSKPAEALVKAQSGYDRSPEDPESLLVLATCLGANQKDPEALLILEKVLDARSDYAEAYANRALIRLRSNDITSAIKDAERTVSLKPHLSQMWSLLGSLYYQSNDISRAIEALRKAQENEPGNADFLVQLGEFLRQADKASEAIPLLERATELAPNDANAWINFGAALQQDEKIADAKMMYEKALELNPQSAAISSNLGAIAKDAGEWETALQYFEKALEIEPDRAEVHDNLGVALKELGRLEEAEANYNQAIALKPEFAEAHNNLGVTLHELGRFDEAEASYTNAIALKPNVSSAYNNLGITLIELGRLDKAKASFTHAIVLSPDYAEAHSNLGFVLLKKGQHREGLNEKLIGDGIIDFNLSEGLSL